MMQINIIIRNMYHCICVLPNSIGHCQARSPAQPLIPTLFTLETMRGDESKCNICCLYSCCQKLKVVEQLWLHNSCTKCIQNVEYGILICCSRYKAADSGGI